MHDGICAYTFLCACIFVCTCTYAHSCSYAYAYTHVYTYLYNIETDEAGKRASIIYPDVCYVCSQPCCLISCSSCTPAGAVSVTLLCDLIRHPPTLSHFQGRRFFKTKRNLYSHTAIVLPKPKLATNALLFCQPPAAHISPSMAANTKSNLCAAFQVDRPCDCGC